MAMRDLCEARSKTVAEMRRITDSPEGDGGDLSDAQSSRFDELKGELSKLESRIERQQAVDDAERRMAAPAIIHGNGRDGQFETRARDFSLTQAILASIGDIPHDGLEREISTELSRRTGRHFSGIGVPDQAFETRTILMGVASPSSGGETLYPTVHRPDLFVDMRRSAMVTATLGATVLGGLMGDQSIPRQIGSSTAQHVAEDGALTETDASFDDIDLSPKTVGALTSFSRRALINASPSVEQLVRRDLAAVVGRAIDFQAVFGNGSGNTPVGVVNQSDVNDLTMATPSWAEVVAFIAAIESDDADIGAMGWLTHPRGVAKLRTTVKVSSTDSVMLMQEPSSLAGFRVATSTAVPIAGSPDATSILFGAWGQLLIGMWSGLDLLSNPYSDTAFPRGRVQVRAMQDYDCAVRHGQSFAMADDLAAT
jgi:HK97 family phage major capsid protein